MGPETVFVYKGDKKILCNKTAVRKWNDAGYKTSAQQKKPAPEIKKEDKD